MSLWKTETSKDGVVVATYTNPPMNYFCADGTRELVELIEKWKSPDVRVVILTGGMAGKFITHYSVEELVEYASDREALRRAGIGLTAGYHGMLDDLRRLPKPVIVAMNGEFAGAATGSIRAMRPNRRCSSMAPRTQGKPSSSAPGPATA